MNPERPLRVLAAPPELLRGAPGRFGPEDCYPGLVWLPVLGPASFLLWRHLARRIVRHPEVVTVSLAQLAVELGLGSPRGTQSAVARSLRRLERFGLLRWVGEDLLVVRQHLPLVTPAQLARLHPLVRARHDSLRERLNGHRF